MTRYRDQIYRSKTGKNPRDQNMETIHAEIHHRDGRPYMQTRDRENTQKPESEKKSAIDQNQRRDPIYRQEPEKEHRTQTQRPKPQKKPTDPSPQ